MGETKVQIFFEGHKKFRETLFGNLSKELDSKIVDLTVQKQN